MEIPIVIVNTQVEALEEPIIPKPVTLIISEIGVNVEVILINNIAHAFEVFKHLYEVLKDTPIVEGPGFELIHLAKLVDTIGEQPVDDLVVGIKHVVLGD
jgi:hypothetical protein